MGSLSSLYISQSYQSLTHLGTNNALSVGTMTELQDGIGQSLNISFDGTNISSSGNIFAANLTGSSFSTGSFATTGSNTFVGVQTITGSNGVLKYSGTNLADTSLASIHANDENPWLERFYNDTFSKTNSVMSYFGWNDGRFVFHNDSTQSIGLQVNGYYAENGLLVYSDKVAFVNNIEVTGSIKTNGNITWAGNSFNSSLTGSLYFSALNGGTLHLNDDGGEGDVVIGYIGSAGKLKVNTDTEISGNLYISGNVYATNLTGSTIATGSFATTGSNTFYGNQTIISGGVIIQDNGDASSLTQTELSIETHTQDAYAYIAAFSHSASMGIISWDGATYDNELWIQADSGGIRMTDWDNGIGNISKTPFMSIGANDGSQPAPIFNRGLITHNAIKGTGSIILQPDLNDNRSLGIYNTAATDTHITASGGNLFLGNDETYVLVTTYANQKEVSIRGDQGITASGSLDISGSLTASLEEGYVWVGDSSNRTVLVATSSFIDTFNSSSLVTTSSFNSYTSSTNARLDSIETTTASLNSSVSALNTNSASVNTSISNLNNATGSYATTGSNSFKGNQTITGSLNVKTITTLGLGNTPLERNASTGTLLVFPYGEYNPTINPNMNDIANSNGVGWVMSGTGITNGNVTSAGYGDNGVEVNITSGNVVSGSSYIGTGPYYPYLIVSGAVYSNTGFITPNYIQLSDADGIGQPFGQFYINAYNGVTASQSGLFSGMIVDGGTAEAKMQLVLSTYNNPYPGEVVPTIYAGGYYDAGLGYGSMDTSITFYSSSIQNWMPTQFKAPVQITGSLNVSNTFTASLANGYAWVGGSNNKTKLVATSSFGSPIPTGTISGSAQITALGFVSSSVTASSLVTASVNLNTITFTKGDGTTFPITVNTGSGGGSSINTGSFATTGSNSFVDTQTITGSVNITGQYLINGVAISGSNISQFATTGSNTFTGDQTINASLFISGSSNSYVQFRSINNATGSGAIYFGNLGPYIQTYSPGSNDDKMGLQLVAGLSGSFALTTRYGGSNAVVDLHASADQGTPGSPESRIRAYSNGAINLEGTGGQVSISGSATYIQDVNFIPFSSSLDSRINAITGSGGSTNTGSLMRTGSVSGNVLTFTKGDATTFSLTVATGSTINTGSFAITGSNTFRGNQIISGTFFQSGSNSIGNGPEKAGTWIKNRVIIGGTDGSNGPTPRLWISGSDGVLTSIGRNFYNIDATKVAGFGAGYTQYGDDTAAVSFVQGVYNPNDGSNDVELYINTDATGTSFQDFDQTSFNYTPWLTIGANDGVTIPTPTFTRGLAAQGPVLFTTGSNKQSGVATLDGGNPGSATISNSLVTANSIIMLTKQTFTDTNSRGIAVVSKGAGTFTISTGHNGDTDQVGWFIINNS
jgi:hypothetical protein